MNLENLNLVELNAREIQETEGVVFGAFAAACGLLYLAYQVGQELHNHHNQ